MKRLISLQILVLLLLSTCDYPISQMNSGSSGSSIDARSQISGIENQAINDSVRNTHWQKFKKLHGQDWKITWNDKIGTPLTVFSGTTQSYSGTPEGSARAFLAQSHSLFGMGQNLSNLELIEVDISRLGIRHVRFRQTHNGVPIHNATYQVHIRPNGKIDMANGHYYPKVEVPTTVPSISKSLALQTIVSDLDSQLNSKKEPSFELMLFRSTADETFLLAWKIIVSTKSTYWKYFVNANNGEILRKIDLSTSITGDGDIIEDYPSVTPNPVNKDFYRLDGSGYLRGTYANVHNDETSRAFSSSNRFQYNTTNTHFDEANVYYHIDIFRAGYMDNLGFTKDIGSDQDLEAWVHDQEQPFNARYVFNAEEVRFGDGLEFAKEDKVIYHEFTHAMADAENGSNEFDPIDNEEGAISEGLADYLPGSYTNRPQIGNSVLSQPRDMENPSITHYSNLSRDQETGEVNEAQHIGGEFFSAVLWDLRSLIGAGTADFLVFDAISRVSGSPTFIEYRDAMMAADDAAYAGSNNDQIQNTFADRGIGSHVPPSVTISGPTNMWQGQSDTFTANVTGGHSPYQYQWYYKHESDVSWTYVSGATSDTYNHTAGEPSGEYVKVVVTDSRSTSNNDTHFFTIIGMN